MPEQSFIGAVIWRELLCRDIGAARSFYGKRFGWDFVTEHASDFTWGEGAGEYTLIRANGAFHGGLAELEAARETGWVSYVMVHNVDEAAGEVAKLGGTILRPPFDVQGVGRNAIVRGPGGARFGLSTPAYAPSGTATAFVADVLIAADLAAARAFLKSLGVAVGTGGVELLARPRDFDRAGLSGADHWLPVISAHDHQLAQRSVSAASSPSTAAAPDDPVRLGAYALHIDPTGACFATFPDQP